MQTPNDNNNNKNIIVGPDYGQMIKLHTNGAIIEACVAMLFSKNMRFNTKSFLVMMRNIAILIALKMALEDIKSFMDKFKITNMSSVKYLYQRFRFSEKKYDFILISGKWKYGDKNISINTLTPFLEIKSIAISQPGTYYYEDKGYIIKVIIGTNKISFAIPNIASVISYMENNVIHNNEEIILGGKTVMSKVVVMQSGVMKVEPAQYSYAYPTENYENLEEAIKTNFFVDSILKFPEIPFCVNFDGEPGTGKTTFGNYIAFSGIFDRIIVCNFVPLANTDFSDALVNLERQIISNAPKDQKNNNEPETILLILDEVDKWLTSYLDSKIHKMREQARQSKQIKDEKSNSATVIENYDKLTEKEEIEKRIQLKNEFLDQLYKLVDGLTFSNVRKYVIIFNTNDFDSIFKDTNPKYNALRDRFQRYIFLRIGKPEITKYLKWLNERLKDSSKVSEEKKKMYESVIQKLCYTDDKVFDLIPDEIKLTYRTLHKILRNEHFNIDKTINALIHYKDNKYFQIKKTDTIDV
ncbi:NTPase family protein [Tupanvirus soda lake]|uniref:NTPase family protein n=2 Tax=Tupanvirus TaxID=2094720 RepID=A0A6N1NNJ4_9VIRU|nr:NTPase family protein [Tupanvirus soda lake]QKU35909.1 NTPase family protein [Tupanvirus soda lake]